MRTRKHRYAIGLLSAVVLAAGCSASSASLAQAPSAMPSPLGISTPTGRPDRIPGGDSDRSAGRITGVER